MILKKKSSGKKKTTLLSVLQYLRVGHDKKNLIGFHPFLKLWKAGEFFIFIL
jgi:hypothetical protein